MGKIIVDKSLILSKLKDFKKFKTDAAFARYIGVSPTVLANWYKRNTFDENKIVNAFPDLNKVWLMTGEGEMLKAGATPKEGDEVPVGKVIPLFDAEAAAGLNLGVDMSPQSRPIAMIEIGSILKDSESALRVYGNSMVPNYPAGCIVGLRTHQDSFIAPGHVYVVETTDDRYLKRLYYNKDKSALRCISDNHMVHEDGPMKGEFYYPEFEIPFDAIRRLFRVIGVIKRNVL